MKKLLNVLIPMCLSLGAASSFALPIMTVTGYGSARGTDTPGAQKAADADAHERCGAQLAQRVTEYTCYGFLGQISCNADYRCVNNIHQPLGFDPDKVVAGFGYKQGGTFEEATSELLQNTKKECGLRSVVQVTDIKCRIIGVTDKYSECRFYYFCK